MSAFWLQVLFLPQLLLRLQRLSTQGGQQSNLRYFVSLLATIAAASASALITGKERQSASSKANPGVALAVGKSNLHAHSVVS